MTNISTQQARTRFKILPQKIQETIFSPDVAEIIYKIGEQNHLPEDKISQVAAAAGLVLLGFIHPEDVSEEIKSSLGIDPRHADDIAKSLNSKLFSPVKSDLEKIYAPLPIYPVEEIKKPELENIPMVPFVQTPAPEVEKIQKPFDITRGGPAPIKLTAEIPKSSVPVLMAPEMAGPAPRPIMKTPAPTAAEKAPIAPTPASPPASEAGKIPAPVIIHEESGISSIKTPTPTFRIEIEKKPIFETASEKPSGPPPAAKLELGPQIKSTTAPKVINYTEARTPINEPMAKPVAKPIMSQVEKGELIRPSNTQPPMPKYPVSAPKPQIPMPPAPKYSAPIPEPQTTYSLDSQRGSLTSKPVPYIIKPPIAPIPPISPATENPTEKKINLESL